MWRECVWFHTRTGNIRSRFRRWNCVRLFCPSSSSSSFLWFQDAMLLSHSPNGIHFFSSSLYWLALSFFFWIFWILLETTKLSGSSSSHCQVLVLRRLRTASPLSPSPTDGGKTYTRIHTVVFYGPLPRPHNNTNGPDTDADGLLRNNLQLKVAQPRPLMTPESR